MKRWRQPKAKPGELKAQWGKLRHNNPDLCYVWGEGTHSADGHFLHHILCSDRLAHDWDAPSDASRLSLTKYEPSFVKELESRGYDITTLRFSIQKKPVS